MPEAVHLAVVDPGVGSERKAVAVESASGALFVGPDNGLLMPAVAASGGPRRAYDISNQRLLPERISATFHGRDIFAPAAAHVAAGLGPELLGAALDTSDLVDLTIPRGRHEGGFIHAEVLQVDRFGNAQLNFGRELLEELDVPPGRALEVVVDGRRSQLTPGHTFAAVETGALVLLEDSYDLMALAVNRGSAAGTLGVGSGSEVVIAPRRP
jgi:S-adenosyl-L-methionine hydrolase (adenosine-forming)